MQLVVYNPAALLQEDQLPAYETELQQSGSCMAGEELTEKDGVGVGNTVDSVVGSEGINVGSADGVVGCSD